MATVLDRETLKIHILGPSEGTPALQCFLTDITHNLPWL